MAKTSNQISKQTSALNKKVNKIFRERYSNLSALSPSPRIPKESYTTLTSISGKYTINKRKS